MPRLLSLLKFSFYLCIASFLILSISYVFASSEVQASLNQTFIASVKNFNQASGLNLDASYLNAPTQEFSDFTEATIDPNGFYLRVDKINLFKAVVQNVDPRYKEEYVASWEKGVSHGKFTATPDQIGVTYLFSHASNSDSTALEQNAWFTNMDEIIVGDEIIIYYAGVKYTYEVSELHIVNPDSTGFYTGSSPVSLVRMQFCGPPTGSLGKRTLVDALLIDSQMI